MTFVENVNQWYKMYSVQAFAVIAAVAATPPDMFDFLPAGWKPWTIGAVAVVGGVLRLVKQWLPADPVVPLSK